MEYYKSRDISNSSLSLINPEQEGSAQKYYKYLNGDLEDIQSRALELGTLIHQYKLEPEQFNALSIDMPSDTICTIIDEVITHSNGEDLSYLREEILTAAGNAEYGGKWKDDTVVSKVIASGGEYYDAILSNEGKQLVDHSTLNTLYQCTTSLNRNRIARDLLDSKSNEHYEWVAEKEVYFEMHVPGTDRTVKCRSKIDRFGVNREAKTFTLVDLKTTSKHISKYGSAFEYYRTYRQLAFYIRAIQSLLGPEYTCDACYIVAVMTTEPHLCRVFKINPSDNYIAKGNEEIDSLISRIDFHTTSGNWVDDMEDIQDPTQFILTLTDDQ